MCRKLFLSSTVLFVLLSLVVSAKANSSMWSRTYGGAGNDQAYSLVTTSDGGYAIAGYTTSFGAGNSDAWLFKTDEYGNMEWNKTYGGPGWDWATSLVTTSDGGYAMLGYYNGSFRAEDDFYVLLVKTDELGNVEWNRTYTDGNQYGFHSLYVSDTSLVATSDGGYALTGGTLFVKTDEFGNMEWNQTYEESIESMVATSDGGYALAGGAGSSFGAGDYDAWLFKTDEFGNMEWNQTYGIAGIGQTYSLVETSDGGYAITGSKNFVGGGGDDFWLVRTDASGNMEWNKTYGGIDNDFAYSLVETSDGGYAIAGYNLTGFGDFEVKLDGRLFKTDESGNMEWNQTYGGTQFDCASSLVETSDGGYAIAGFTVSLDDSWDVWLIKTDEYGVVPEYSSWLIPSLLLTATFVIVIYKKKFFDDHP